MLMQFLLTTTTHAYLANTKLILFQCALHTHVLFECSIYSTLALSRLVCAYTLSCHTSGTSAGREGGGGVHTSHIAKTLVSVELTSVLRLVRATSYNTRACVIAGGSRHSINTSTCTWQRYATLRLQTYNILVPFCRLFHVI